MTYATRVATSPLGRRSVRWWQAEALVVCLAMSVVTAASSGGLRDWLAVSGVTFSFLYSQLSSAVAEFGPRWRPEQAARAARTLTLYMAARELSWVAYFACINSWSAVGGAVVFVGYPAWRRWRRSVGGTDGASPGGAPNPSTAVRSSCYDAAHDERQHHRRLLRSGRRGARRLQLRRRVAGARRGLPQP